MAKEQIGVLIERGLKDKVESQLGYNDSMSGWVRAAIIEKLERDGVIDEGNSIPTPISQTAD